MTFQESLRVCFMKYAEFDGQAGRSEYWWFALFVVAIGSVAATFGQMPYGLFSLGVLLPVITVTARRLHDTGRSGWWQLIAIVPVLGLIALIVMLAQKGRTS